MKIILLRYRNVEGKNTYLITSGDGGLRTYTISTPTGPLLDPDPDPGLYADRSLQINLKKIRMPLFKTTTK